MRLQCVVVVGAPVVDRIGRRGVVVQMMDATHADSSRGIRATPALSRVRMTNGFEFVYRRSDLTALPRYLAFPLSQLGVEIRDETIVYDGDDFLESFSDPDGDDAEEVARVRALAVGESHTIGGGAWAAFRLERVS